MTGLEQVSKAPRGIVLWAKKLRPYFLMRILNRRVDRDTLISSIRWDRVSGMYRIEIEFSSVSCPAFYKRLTFWERLRLCWMIVWGLLYS